MRRGSDILRIVRRRRLRTVRGGRSLRPAGWILLLAVGAAWAAGTAVVLAPLTIPLPELDAGIRPRGAQFLDRNGRLVAQAGSVRAAESRWYMLADAPEDDCVLSAFLAARGISLQEIRSPAPLDVAQAAADALLGGKDLTTEAADAWLAMSGRPSGVWDRARLAGAIAARYSRLQRAEWILNTALYGGGAVGIDDAALTYFSRHAGELTGGQCAALEALTADPAVASDADGWRAARDNLLDRMLDADFLEQAEYEQAVRAPIQTADGWNPEADPVFGGKLPILDSFLRLAADRLGDRYPPEELPRAGLRITLTLDLDYELQLICAAQNLLSPPPESEDFHPTLDGAPCDLAELLGPAAQGGLPEDLALAVIDPAGGELLAYFDTARGGESAGRAAAGAALLPFVYLSAFTRGFSPASMLLDIPRADSPERPDAEYLGPLSARTALQRKAPAAAAMMAESVGSDHIARILSLLGLIEPGESTLSFTDRLERETDLVSLTRAYATLAAGGLETADEQSGTPATILSVADDRGSVWEAYGKRTTRRIFGSDLAYLMQDILSEKNALADLDSPALAGSRSAVAAVSGSSWSFAFTPEFAVGVINRGYAGQEEESISSWPLAQAAAGWALRGLPDQTWTEPPGIVRRDVCVPSGLLPSRYCPNVRSEIFIAGNEPSQVDSFYRPVAVNRESGRLATLWTPLALVEEEVFFNLEGEARIWAERSGFPIPPDTYDTLPDSFPYEADLHFTDPAPLSVMRGNIIFRGTVAVDGLANWVVEAGSGLFPSVWYTLGSGEQPVSEGILAVWDASQAGGIWSVQLTAVLDDGKIRTAAIPLTLDNVPPVIRWIVPDAPQRITLAAGDPLILQVEVADDLDVEAVEFYLDGLLRTRLAVGPYSVRWPGLTSGGHSVKICARDLSGNGTCTQELEVIVELKTNGGLTYNTPGKAAI
jgi:membrane peptidoglycan carboxypeptidase